VALMKASGRLLRIVFVLALLAAVGTLLPVQAKRRSTTSRHGFHAPVLGVIDRVEVLSIDDSGQDIGPINGTRTLKGSRAQQLATIWRKQRLAGPSAAACHYPPFAVKFYSGKRVLLYASVCWACSNIDFIVPRREYRVKFLADSANGQLLYETFRKAFGD
jgi:hypothetical protein